jgi:transcriptional regulator with XRE-family HTH domain
MTKGPALAAGNDSPEVSAFTMSTIGRALEERRRELGIGQEVAADAVGVSRSTFAAYEHDTRRISPEVLRPLAHFLDVSLVEVLELYGATCVAQARRVLFGDEPPAPPSPFSGARARRATRDDMSIVERVYFDTVPEKVPAVALATFEERAGHAASPVGDAGAVVEGESEKKRKKKHKKKSAAKNDKRAKDDKRRPKGKAKEKAKASLKDHQSKKHRKKAKNKKKR